MRTVDPALDNILVLLTPAAMKLQREEMKGYLSSSLAGATLQFASSLEAIADIGSVQIVIAPTLPWLPEVLSSAKELKWIHFLSAGVDNIWKMNFNGSEVMMSKSSGVHAIPITEYVIGTMLYFVKEFGRFQRQQERKEWNRSWLEELNSKTLGILGLGNIGQRIAKIAKQFGMRVIGTVSTPREIKDVDEVYPSDDLHLVLSAADFVVVTVPLTPSTTGLLTYERLSYMKKTAYLINVARGAVIDEKALIKILKEENIAGAALDVFTQEPLEGESELWHMDNVLITPHVSGTTPQYMNRALKIFLKNYDSLIEKGVLMTPVSHHSKY